MTEKVLIDTDVIIDYLRGSDAAISYLESANSRLAVSVITVAELFSGVREGKERETLDVFLSAFELIPLTNDIAVKGGLHRRDYGKSHSVGLADALIAATAESEKATLVTLNKKHFPMLSDVYVPYAKV